MKHPLAAPSSLPGRRLARLALGAILVMMGSLPRVALAEPIADAATLESVPWTFGATRAVESVMQDVGAIARPMPPGETLPTLAERPIALDFRDHSWTMGYRFRHDQVLVPAPAPGFPNLVFDVKQARNEGFVEYRRRLLEDFEVGLRLSYLGLKEARPTRIAPAATAPFFTASEDVLEENGPGDAELSIARAWNRPGLSRRLGLDVRLPTARTDIPDPRSLPLGTGQADFELSYGLKRTRGSFALTGTAGVNVRSEGDTGTFAGGTVSFDPGDELFVKLRADRSIERWWTASLAVEGRVSNRDALAGVEQAGSSRQFLAVTPSFTMQASPLFEVIAEVEIPVETRNVADTALYGLSLRWRH